MIARVFRALINTYHTFLKIVCIKVCIKHCIKVYVKLFSDVLRIGQLGTVQHCLIAVMRTWSFMDCAYVLVTLNVNDDDLLLLLLLVIQVPLSVNISNRTFSLIMEERLSICYNMAIQIQAGNTGNQGRRKRAVTVGNATVQVSLRNL